MCWLLFSDDDFAVPRELVGNNRILVLTGWKNLLNQKLLAPFLLLAETRSNIESPVDNNCLERDYNVLARPSLREFLPRPVVIQNPSSLGS